MATAYLVSNKYNYSNKFSKAMREGNTKYIKSLIKRGKVTLIDVDAHTDSCGNFAYATLKQ